MKICEYNTVFTSECRGKKRSIFHSDYLATPHIFRDAERKIFLISRKKKWIISFRSVRIWETRMLVGSREGHALSTPHAQRPRPRGKWESNIIWHPYLRPSQPSKCSSRQLSTRQSPSPKAHTLNRTQPSTQARTHQRNLPAKEHLILARNHSSNNNSEGAAAAGGGKRRRR